ncbi:hypothetical protein GCM10009676_35550 [Prauserella halophila]|uniref:Uncharacterized protein n=1 Tax=Prauserella halophila TaxID=185641 RepID=A0ABP4H0P8_9PSEU|nr:hypothetical protein [Prauserella halophila]MCP2238336.1 hypothetical protein [Prauserella halophila]
MNISRRDDRHNADLAQEISDSFNRALGERKTAAPGTGTGPDGTGPGDEENDGDHGAASDGAASDGAVGDEQQRPRFVITGDRRSTGRNRRP